MALITQLTLEQKQSQVKQRILAGINQNIAQLQGQFTSMFASVWLNPELTAQEVFDAFGTDAAAMFMIAAQTQGFLNTLKPGSCTQIPPKTYTINADGTVSVGT